MTYSPDFGES